MFIEKEAPQIPVSSITCAARWVNALSRIQEIPGYKMLLEKINLIFPINLYRNRHPPTLKPLIEMPELAISAT
jgi:hypothetical protein